MHFSSGARKELSVSAVSQLMEETLGLSVDVLDGCAAEIVRFAREAGVKLIPRRRDISRQPRPAGPEYPPRPDVSDAGRDQAFDRNVLRLHRTGRDTKVTVRPSLDLRLAHNTVLG